jgi:hypothetical protein
VTSTDFEKSDGANRGLGLCVRYARLRRALSRRHPKHAGGVRTDAAVRSADLALCFFPKVALSQILPLG